MMLASLAIGWACAVGPCAASLEWPLAHEVPEVPPPVETASPLFRGEVWARLPPVPDDVATWLQGRIPGLRADNIRRLALHEADAVLGEAAARGLGGLDLFTDSGLREDRVYLIEQGDIAELFGRFELRVINLASGVADDGRNFEMQAMVLGAGRVHLLYSIDDFRFSNPYFPDHDFRFRSLVSYTIEGPGQLGMSGVWVDVGIVDGKIERWVKIAPDRVRIHVRVFGQEVTRENELRPIRRLPGPSAGPVSPEQG